MRRLSAFILVLSLSLLAFAAPPRLSFDALFDLVHLYIDTSDEIEDDDENMKLHLEYAYANPINWNTATHSQLSDLDFIPDPVIDELLYYAYAYGPVRSINELILVPNVDDRLRDILSTLMSVSDTVTAPPWTDAFKSSHHRIAARTDVGIEQRAGFLNGAYPGYPFRQLVKYQMSASSSFQAALTMETDAGEPWNVRGFDLYRGYAQFSSFLNDSRVVVGSYNAQFGAGLVIGGSGYGSFANQLRNFGYLSKISGYAGVDGSPVPYGVAASLSPRRDITLTALYGYSPLDASIQNGMWSNVITDGYHRTLTERANDNTLSLHTIAAHILYQHTFFKIGATAYAGFFSLPSTDFGKRQWAASIDYSTHFSHFTFSGETSVCQSYAFATTNNIAFAPMPDLSFIVNIRYFSDNYNAFWAGTYARYSRISGEQGISLLTQIPFYRLMTLEFFTDVTRNNTPTSILYGSPMDYELRTKYNAKFSNSSIFTASLRFRQLHSLYISDLSDIQKLECDQTYNIKLHYRCPFDNGFTSASGFQMSLARSLQTSWSPYSFGWLIYQDLDYQLPTLQLLFRARMALFDAPTWANRFFVTEAHIAESSYSPSLYGKGLRWYFIAKYSAPFGLSVQFRVAQTLYADRTSIGSNNDLIASWHRTELNILLAYKF